MTVDLGPGESLESLLKRFRKQVIASGVLSAYRQRRWFVSKGEQRRIAKKKGIRRAKRKFRRRQTDTRKRP
jgi:small subunit ribosomal protein S21